MLSQNLSENAAERPGPTQLGKGLFRIARRQSAPDRHALLDIACFAQGGDGIAVDRLGFQTVIEEPVNDAGAVQQDRRCPAFGRYPQPRDQHVLTEFVVTLGDVLEAMQYLAVAGSAFLATQIKACEIVVNGRAIGIGPASGHASTSVPGTSSAMALRSSVASLR